MYDENNIFAKIIRGEIPCNKIYEDDTSLFFHDINPTAKIHALGVPKSSCIDFADFINKNNSSIVAGFFNNVEIVIEKLGIKESGYRLISNSGINGRQEVPHFHIHILGGERL